MVDHWFMVDNIGVCLWVDVGKVPAIFILQLVQYLSVKFDHGMLSLMWVSINPFFVLEG